MSDAISQAIKDNKPFREKAFEKYGNLSKQEIFNLGDELNQKLKDLEQKREELDKEYYKVRHENDMLNVVFYDGLNKRKWKDDEALTANEAKEILKSII